MSCTHLPQLLSPAVECSECAVIIQQHHYAVLAPQVAVAAVSTRHRQEHRRRKLQFSQQQGRQADAGATQRQAQDRDMSSPLPACLKCLQVG